MLTLYPSNKLEHLSFLLATLFERQPSLGFNPDIVLVESPGMQHWLNMQLATHRGIAMNMHFPLPVRFMWDMARTVLGEDSVPHQSPFRREILRWRLLDLFNQHTSLEVPAMARVKRYFTANGDSKDAGLTRLQLATSFADLIEQYLLYRPDWLLAWENGQRISEQDPDEEWQAHIWRLLVNATPEHPANLHVKMITALADPAPQVLEALPKRITLFAINTMAPQFVEFLNALGRVVDIHLFHLNPCVNYWGNVASKSQQAHVLRQQGIEAWMAQSQDNPLLANLGKQGRDLFNQITALDCFEISAFDLPEPQPEISENTLLSQIQTDILEGSNESGHFVWKEQDASVVVSSAHSALREVQALHDHLLTQFAENETLQPRDVLVMCPAIEHYASCIDAVFARTGSGVERFDESPRIPCSIADRAPLDDDPLVAAFLMLLTLPDSRFQVNQIVELLALPPLQRKFGLSVESLEVTHFWLQQANVHWGLDAQHKARITENPAAEEMYSWHWGLQRLMLGMIAIDQRTQFGDCISVPDVEGQESIEFGRLIAVIEGLMLHNSQLNQARTAKEWQTYLSKMVEECFTPIADEINSWETILKSIADLSVQSEQADVVGYLSLAEVREVLTKRFSIPDAGNQFMTGQVTFCSMLPMRSIPFKVIAILGLNDGEFPRTNPPSSISLLTRNPQRTGDRSRRLEDRYLFLEAIISARESLYLSYQGNSSQDNTERQPSLVLRELMDFIDDNYAWKANHAIRQRPLHPFSSAVFYDKYPSYSAGWCRLAKAIVNQPYELESNESSTFLPEVDLATVQQGCLSSKQIAQCFSDPLAWLGKLIGLQLVIPNDLLDDAEPFETNNLNRFQYVDEALNTCFAGGDLASIDHAFLMSGDLPNNSVTAEVMASWKQASLTLFEALENDIGEPTRLFAKYGDIELYAPCYKSEREFIQYHVTQHSSRHSFGAWITFLIACSQGAELPLYHYYIDWKNNQKLSCERFSALDCDTADGLLQQIVEALLTIQQQPQLLHLHIGEALVSKANMNVESWDWQQSDALLTTWEGLIDQTNQYCKLANDPYFSWFYNSVPEVNDLPLKQLAQIYCPFLQRIEKVKL